MPVTAIEKPIVVHHLQDSRSQRILFLLEELGVDYEVRRYEREDGLAPPELKAVHPLGKAPVVSVGDRVLAESGAIVETLAEAHPGAGLVPARGTEAFDRYRYWLHAAEGSIMPLLVLSLVLRRIDEAPMPFFARPIARGITGKVRMGYLDESLDAHVAEVDRHLGEHPWFAGADFSAADVQMSFPLETIVHGSRGGATSAIEAWVEKVHARPAYRRALERGGDYAYAGSDR